MRHWRTIVLVLVVLGLCLAPGCGNVSLKGQALTQAQSSTMNAYQASIRAEADPASTARDRVYLSENFRQWRWFVRSATKDMTWGPKLPVESATQPAGK